jgi:hypothetical protein
MFYSAVSQDEFVANILGFKKNGYCVDIGSGHSIESNNTFYFQSLDWCCISVEIDSSFNETYLTRKNGVHLNENALRVEYENVLSEYEFPTVVDYLSLDVDTCSLNVLKILPLDKYKFKIITIEHDAYLYNDKYREDQRRILTEAGYKLLCSNVLVPNPGHSGYNGEDCPFEDWWIYPSEFNSNITQKIECDMSFPSEIISKVKSVMNNE